MNPKETNENNITEFLNLLLSEETKKHYSQYFKHIFDFLYKSNVKFFLDYTFQEFKALIIWLDGQQWSRSEKQKHIIALMNFREKCEEPWLSKGKRYRKDIDWDYTFDFKRILGGRNFQDKPSRKLKKHYFTADQWKELLQKVKERNPYEYVLFRLFESACRIGGMIRLKVADIDLEIGYITSIEKSGKVRYFLPQNFLEELKWYISTKKLNPTDYLIPSPRFQGQHLNKQAIENMFTRYTKINPHDCRRSITRLFAQAGVPEADLYMVLNHKPNMNGVYAIVDVWEETKAASVRYQLAWNKVMT